MTQRLVEGVPTRRLMDDPERWSSGLFYDWTHGLADAIHHAGKHPASVLFVVVLLEKVGALRSSHGCFMVVSPSLFPSRLLSAAPAGDVTKLSTVGLPVSGEGSVGAWLEHAASPVRTRDCNDCKGTAWCLISLLFLFVFPPFSCQVERRNFFELVFMLSTFEKRLGLQQSTRTAPNGGIEIQLGSQLKCILEFRVGNLQ